MPRATPSAPSRPTAGALLMLAAACPAAAQLPAPRVDSGAVVRVRSRAAALRGERFTVAGVRGDTLLLRGRGPDAAWRVPIADVDELAVRVGRRPRRDAAERGALIGLALAAVPTIVLYPAAAQADANCTGYCIVSARAALVIAGGVLSAITMTTGAVIGYNRPGERWERVEPRRLRLGVAPVPGGGAVAVGLRF